MKVKLDDVKLPKHLMRLGVNQDGIESLASSIKAIGLTNPITVGNRGKGYELIAGYRRLCAHKYLGLDEIEVIVSDRGSKDWEAVKVAENLEREAVNAVDEGDYFFGLMQKKGMTQKKLAKQLGRSEAYVSQRLSAVGWHAQLRTYVQTGQIGFSVARELSQVKDPLDMERLVEAAIRGGCTPSLARQWKDEANRQPMPDNQNGQAATPSHDGGSEPTHGLTCQTCGDTDPKDERSSVTVCPVCAQFVQALIKEALFAKNRIEVRPPQS